MTSLIHSELFKTHCEISSKYHGTFHVICNAKCDRLFIFSHVIQPNIEGAFQNVNLFHSSLDTEVFLNIYVKQSDGKRTWNFLLQTFMSILCFFDGVKLHECEKLCRHLHWLLSKFISKVHVCTLYMTMFVPK